VLGLLGRHDESRQLDRLLDDVRAGRSRALLMHGEPGVGKTALLDHLVEQAPDYRVARVAGMQAEAELAFAGLHQLCSPFLDRLDELPAPQHEALAVAFGVQAGDPPDRFLIGLATLSLLAEVSQRQPLLCVVDDAQWFDTASLQALTFAARRMVAERIALVFAARDTNNFERIPELLVAGLDEDDARALLRTVLTGPDDPRVIDRVVAESRGIPLALLELPRGLSRAQVASGFGLPGGRSVLTSVEKKYVDVLRELPDDTRRLLVVAAAEPLGDPVLTWRAAESLGVGLAAAGPAEAAGLAEFGTRIRFRHPLVRSAIYASAPRDELRAAHSALAAATDPEADPDRRAWHRSQSVTGLDDEVAAELEQSAGRAQARGGVAAAAAFMARAVELSGAAASRNRRALAPPPA
jgi:hypothetical protein